MVNEHECAAALGVTPDALQTLAPNDRQSLLAKGRISHVVVTRGSDSTLHVSADAMDVVPTMAVTPVDTVGAGDTFAGILATRLAEGLGWPAALCDANAVAALATLALGAQAAMPTRDQVAAVRR